MNDVEIPLPQETEENRPFWESARRHALRLQKCTSCDTYRYPVAPYCPECLSEDAEWVPVSGKATVFGFTIIHQRYHPYFADKVPYNVAVVELEEGPKLVTNIVDIANENIRIGMPVTITYQEVVDGFTLPKFRPQDADR